MSDATGVILEWVAYISFVCCCDGCVVCYTVKNTQSFEKKKQNSVIFCFY